MNTEHPVCVEVILPPIPRETPAEEGQYSFCFNLLYWSGMIDSKVFVPIGLRKETCYCSYFAILTVLL